MKVLVPMLAALVLFLVSPAQSVKPITGSVKPITDTGVLPQVFAPGIMSTPYSEWSTSFAPDGKTVYSSQGAVYWTIVYSKFEGGRWMKPGVLPFSGRWRDTDPFMSPDGKRLFFISNRPMEDSVQDKPQAAFHIWYADHLSGDQWGTPHRVSEPVNLTGISNYAPSVSRKGTLFFCTRGRNGQAGMRSYAAKWMGDRYSEPQAISFAGVDEVQDPFIAADESYLLFVSGNDIYISWRGAVNEVAWGSPEKLGPEVNNGDGNSSPYVSPDGKMLYYSSGSIKGFFKRDVKAAPADYDQLVKENEGLFNGQSNILMIPVHLPV